LVDHACGGGPGEGASDYKVYHVYPAARGKPRSRTGLKGPISHQEEARMWIIGSQRRRYVKTVLALAMLGGGHASDRA